MCQKPLSPKPGALSYPFTTPPHLSFRWIGANWAGKTRDLQKHLWKLPVPLFNPDDPLHVEVSEAGRVAADGAADQLERLRQERERVTVTIARRELRNWLRESEAGKAVEEAVRDLLDGA